MWSKAGDPRQCMMYRRADSLAMTPQNDLTYFPHRANLAAITHTGATI